MWLKVKCSKCKKDYQILEDGKTDTGDWVCGSCIRAARAMDCD